MCRNENNESENLTTCGGSLPHQTNNADLIPADLNFIAESTTSTFLRFSLNFNETYCMVGRPLQYDWPSFHHPAVATLPRQSGIYPLQLHLFSIRAISQQYNTDRVIVLMSYIFKAKLKNLC